MIKQPRSTMLSGRGKRYINWPLINKLTSLLFISSLALWGYIEFTDAERFPINRVSILGEYSHTPTAAIEAMITPHVQQGFFKVSLKTLQIELEQFPWLAKAIVKRQWPDTLVVSLAEYKPYCRWNNTAIIASDTTLFMPKTDLEMSTKGLPFLYGPEGKHLLVLSMFQNLSQALQPLKIKIASLSLDNYYTWHMTLTNGLTVNLGRNDIMQQIGKFVKTYPKIFADHPDLTLTSVDMRYQHGMAVKWQ